MEKIIPNFLYRFFTNKCKKCEKDLIDWRGVCVCRNCDLI